MVDDLADSRRIEPDFVLPERQMLEAWLDFHRMTLLLKCEDLDSDARRTQPVTTSLLSLHGLVRHMAEVERNWFRRVLLRESEVPDIWRTPENQDGDLAPIDDADWSSDLAAWQAECEASRRAASSHVLDDTGIRNGKPCSLRWIYVHMIEEYARHNGHADILRELVDGDVGW